VSGDSGIEVREADLANARDAAGLVAVLEQAAEAHALRACCKLTLEVQDDNTRARALYRSFGFSDFVIGDEQAPTRFLSKAIASM
jgi:hypothetical protein